MYKYNSVASGTTKIVSAVLFPGLNPNCIHSASISYLKHAFHHLINFTILHNFLSQTCIPSSYQFHNTT